MESYRLVHIDTNIGLYQSQYVADLSVILVYALSCPEHGFKVKINTREIGDIVITTFTMAPLMYS